MTNGKSLKRALLSSAFSLIICVAMLIGTTFAWFTDTASTAVNKIQAGNLDVALEMQKADGTWESAEGKTLTFKTADNRAAENILWEPGCRYELPALRVVNNGNLALKYKLAIIGIKGDAKLNEVIEWTINDSDINLTEEHLLAGEKSAAITVKGHMKEAAGNEYQGLSIDGIGITVYAAQYAYALAAGKPRVGRARIVVGRGQAHILAADHARYQVGIHYAAGNKSGQRRCQSRNVHISHSLFAIASANSAIRPLAFESMLRSCAARMSARRALSFNSRCTSARISASVRAYIAAPSCSKNSALRVSTPSIGFITMKGLRLVIISVDVSPPDLDRIISAESISGNIGLT